MCMLATYIFLRMAGEPNPTLSPNECNCVPLTDREDLSTVPQPQQQQDARRKAVNERPIQQPCGNLRPVPVPPLVGDGIQASIGLDEEGVRRQLWQTARTQAQSDCVGQNTATNPEAQRSCLPVSSSFTALDSESQQKLNDSHAVDRVQRRAVEERHIAALTSQASDISSQLPPLSSGEIAEEQGEDKELDQPPLERAKAKFTASACMCHVLTLTIFAYGMCL